MASDPRSASIQTQPQSSTNTGPFGYGTSAQRPSNPTRGFLYFDTTLQREIVFTAAGWQIIGPTPTPMVGFGTWLQRPSGPAPGFIYYATTDSAGNATAAQYTWNGLSWVQTSPATSTSYVGTGSTAQRPTNPPQGYLFWDTDTLREYAWSGSAWIMIGPANYTPPVAGVPVITSEDSATGLVVGTPFTYQITATNTPTSYAVSSGTLPTGLSLDTVTGIISGTPTVTYNTSVSLTATNGSGTSTPFVFYILVSAAAAGIPVITSASSAAGVVGTSFSYQITATNYPSSYSSTTLPSGLTLNTTTGLITGTPVTTSSGTITISATNSLGTGSASLLLTVTATAVTSGRWDTVSATPWLRDQPNITANGATLSVVVADATPSVLTMSISGATLTNGFTWVLYGPSGNILDYGGSSSLIYSAFYGKSVNINAAGGYSLTVSSNVSMAVTLGLSIAGGGKFSSSSLQAPLTGASLQGVPTGGATNNPNAMSMTISGVTPTTLVASADFSSVSTGGALTTLQSPNYYWSLGGDTTNNPKTNFASGLTTVELVGRQGVFVNITGLLRVSG